MANPELKIDGLWRQGTFAGVHQEDLVFASQEDGPYWLGRFVDGTLRFNLAGTAAAIEDAKGAELFATGNFTGSGQTEILLWHHVSDDYWLGRFTDDEVTFTYAGNTSRLGKAEGVSLVWTGDFTGSGQTEILFWYPAETRYWLGRFIGDDLHYTLAGNTAGFAGAERISLIWTGDFTGSGKTEVLFRDPRDGSYWLGRFTGDQITYTLAGNTAGSGGAEGVSLIWTGDFTGSGKTQILLWDPRDESYWLGRFTGDQISYTLAGNTAGSGGAEGVSRIWTGDFTGSGKTEILRWDPRDESYWLGRFTGDQIAYSLAGNAVELGGAESVSLVRIGNFSGSGKAELLVWHPGDGAWWSGRFTGAQLTYSPAGNTGPSV